jgi:hypothetical protein
LYNLKIEKMKATIKAYIPRWIPACLMLLIMTCCAEDNNEWSKDYDIEWPVSTITNVQPLSAVPGDIITITGTNLQYTYTFYIGSFACEVTNMSDTQLSVKVPELVTEESTVSVLNLYRRSYIYEGGLFTPIIL